MTLVYMQALSVGYTVPLAILSWHADLVVPVLGIRIGSGIVKVENKDSLSP